MKTTVDFCGIKWNWERFKYPKLWELYKTLFWEYFIWAHDAIVDVEATLKAFLELNNRWIISVKEILVSRIKKVFIVETPKVQNCYGPQNHKTTVVVWNFLF